MRHLKRGRHLGRNASHRKALMRNLATALIAHERIITTVAKAKELRPFVERLITLAKRDSVHARRLVIARLGGKKEVPLPEKDGKEPDPVRVVTKLFEDLAPRYKDRPGGYTRIIKRHERRLGDAGETAYIELLREGETKAEKTAPARPKVTEARFEDKPALPPPAEPSAPAAEEKPPETPAS
jgi:large subunit ribosomal protein L17